MWAAVLAQLVERKALNLVVQGSSPWDGVFFLFFISALLILLPLFYSLVVSLYYLLLIICHRTSVFIFLATFSQLASFSVFF